MKNYGYSGVQGQITFTGPKGSPDLPKLANELDAFWPENSTLMCSLFTWFWIKEACDGVMYQHGEEIIPFFVYFSPKQDGFYRAFINVDNSIPKYKVRITKVG
jgi:hypothetical protein